MDKVKVMAPFNAVLGTAEGNVDVYSSDYDSADQEHFPNRHAFRNMVDNLFMGYKWQCVELARRWMYMNKGYLFDDVAMAYDIFSLTSVRVVNSDERLPLKSFKNGSKRHPEPGALLIWNEGGEFETTGHVAVVTEVTPTAIRIIEQNVENLIWPEGQNYSRELAARVTDEGDYWIRCTYETGNILGWVIQTDDDTGAESLPPADSRLLNLVMKQVETRQTLSKSWLNIANPDENAYVKMMGGHKLSSNSADELRYFCISETATREVKRATNELHALFMHATDYVLQHETLLEQFNIPSCLWSKIRQSWDNRRNQMITGRFDFSISDRGIKVYEYNADSASCYMEAGKIQGMWAQHVNCKSGRDAGDELFKRLIKSWKASDAKGVIHIMQDKDLEETYHALFMKEAIEAAGIKCKIITGVDELVWTDDGSIADAEGEVIKWVWKTWAWETALDQIRAECNNDPDQLMQYVPGEVHGGKIRLVDVLLRQEVMVYEPLWTLIPSNKAILPVLWELFPHHPYLLPAYFENNDSLRETGFVMKPIVGRCGDNIRMVDSDSQLIETTAGRFAHHSDIYQALWPLPKIDAYNAQLCTFTVEGRFSGSCVRVDANPVIKSESDVMALRVVTDEQL